jgi:hypothetical protein
MRIVWYNHSVNTVNKEGAMAPRYRVTLTREERIDLEAISTKGKRAARTARQIYSKTYSPADLQRFEVSSDSIILIITMQLQAEITMLFTQRLMTVITAPFPNGFHKTIQTLTNRLLLNHPISLPHF